MPSSKSCRSIPAYRSSVSFRSVRAAGGFRTAGPCFARNARPCVRGRAGVLRRRGSCARLPARPCARRRAGQRAHPSRPLTPGRLRRPSHRFLQKAERRPRKPPFSHAHSTPFLRKSIIHGNKNGNIGQLSCNQLNRRDNTGSAGLPLMGDDAPPSPRPPSLPHARIPSRLVSGAPAGPATPRSAPLLSPRPLRGDERERFSRLRGPR